MKLKPQAIDAFLARPDGRIATVLIYGPDAGLVAERARTLAGKVVDELSDPFRVSELTADELRSAPRRLVEEAQALCLMGGRRLVRVRDAGDVATPAVRDLLALPAQEGFVVLEAGDLGGGSSLRKLVEDAAMAAALPCYRDEAAALGGLVRALLAEHQLRAGADVADYLESHLGGDRAVTRAEIAKLALYMADRPGAMVNLEDAAAIVGDSSALGVEDAVHAAVLGRRPELERALERLLAEGEAPVRLIRAAATLLLRLLRLSGGLSASSVESVLASARPPIFFRHRAIFAEALRRWTPEALAAALAMLQAAELRCKSAAAPDALLCRVALAQLATFPRARGQSRADGGGNPR